LILSNWPFSMITAVPQSPLRVHIAPLLADHRAEPIGDVAVTPADHALIDQRRARRAVAHPGHQLTQARPRRGEGVPRVPKIMEVHVGRDPCLLPGLDPVVSDVAATEPTAPRAEEDVTVTTGPCKSFEVPLHVRQEFGRECHRSDTGIRLRSLVKESSRLHFRL
jgi:hypothetical protein